MFGRTKVAMIVAEFLATATLASVVLSVANSRIGFPLFIAAAAGFTVALLTFLFSRSSGAHANPAVTLGLWTLRKISTAQAVVYIAAQLLGGVAALRLFEYLTGKPLTNIATGNFEWKVLIAEAVGTFIFGFAIAASFNRADTERNSAVIWGSALALGIIIASVASNGLLNPALAISARSVNRAYLIGPVVGSIIGMNLYQMVFGPGLNLRLNGFKRTKTAAVSANRRTSVAKKSKTKAAKRSTKKPASRRK